MNSTCATLTLPTRPKIHRFPAAARPEKKNILTAVDFPKLYVGVAVMLVVVGMGIGASPHQAEIPAAIPEEVDQVKIITPEASAKANPAISLMERNSSDTIVIKGESGGIIGQMAKIPTPNVQITEIQGISNVDKSASRDLLSIVNKY